MITSRIWPSVQLTMAALVIANVVGLPLGVIAALKENTIWDRISVTISLIGQSFPLFWIGLIFILIGAGIMTADIIEFIRSGGGDVIRRPFGVLGFGLFGLQTVFFGLLGHLVITNRRD
jgi:ABC-type dipeptide/oligopeptide/nickel transport system permease component